MKHISIIFLAALLAVGATSCKKEPDPENNPDTPEWSAGTFAEGIYKPSFHIQSILEGETPLQEWTWGSTKLSSIVDNEEGTTYTFEYSGDMVSSVYNEDANEQYRYTYGGSLLTKVEMFKDGNNDLTMTLSHDANDHISRADLDLSLEYIMDLVGGNVFKKRALARLIGPRHAETLCTALADLQSKGNGAKLEMSDPVFSIANTWQGDNISQSVFSGTVTISFKASDIPDFILNLIPDNYRALLNLLGNTSIPLKVTFSSTSDNTFDSQVNPTYCLYVNGIGDAALSANNITRVATTEATKFAINLSLFSFDTTFRRNSNQLTSYTYDEHGLPLTYTTDETTYTINY